VKKRSKGRKQTNGLLESVKEDPLEDLPSSKNVSIEEEEKNSSSLVASGKLASKKNSQDSEEFESD
jgi:hypothetical protein